MEAPPITDEFENGAVHASLQQVITEADAIAFFLDHYPRVAARGYKAPDTLRREVLYLLGRVGQVIGSPCFDRISRITIDDGRTLKVYFNDLFRSIAHVESSLRDGRLEYMNTARTPLKPSDDIYELAQSAIRAACSDLKAKADEIVPIVSQLQELVPEWKPTTGGVFICHSSEDKPFVRRLSADLVSNGLRVWFDEWEMLPGDSLYDKIQQGIEKASWFIIVLSPASVDSKWCKRELHHAMEEEFERNKVYVIPVLYRDCTLPGFLKEKIWADARDHRYSGALDLLLKRFAQIPLIGRQRRQNKAVNRSRRSRGI